jgi:TPR repeat protein
MYALRSLRNLLVTLTLAIPFVPSAHADAYDDGMLAYTSGRYEDALSIWTGLASDGNARAQFNLAYMYEFGISVDADPEHAVKWYRLAAEQGYARAQNFLGWMYEMGKGVAHDRAEALKWLRLAADQGSDDAQADYRLVANRKKRQDETVFKEQMFDALRVEMERAQERHDQIRQLPPAPREIEASNHTS